MVEGEDSSKVPIETWYHQISYDHMDITGDWKTDSVWRREGSRNYTHRRGDDRSASPNDM